MVRIYCRHTHGHHLPCDECGEFLRYAQKRLQRCRYGSKKPICRLCKTHCYSGDRKALATKIMRYAGPRMLLRHPLLALHHLYEKYRYRAL